MILELSVVIVSWNTRDLLRSCLQTLKCELAGIDAEVFVIDNHSADGSAEMVASEHDWVRLIANQENRGFAAGNNQAFRLAMGKKVLLLNPDTEVAPGSIRSLMGFLDEHPQCAVVAPQLLNSDGSIQQS